MFDELMTKSVDADQYKAVCEKNIKEEPILQVVQEGQ